jgi:OPT family oligopeptide transporter
MHRHHHASSSSSSSSSSGGGKALSVRAILSGSMVGIVIASMNVSFGLKTGWSQAGSVLAACISIGLFALIKPKLPFSKEEANVAQTVASAAGSMTMSAGLIGPMPALALLGYEHTYLGLASWSISVAYLGVFLAVPLRDHFLVQHRLKFPSGTATAECIRAAFALPPSGGGGGGGGAGNSFSGSGNVEMGEMKGGDSLDGEQQQQQQQPEDRARKQFKSLLFAAFVSFATAMVAWKFPKFLKPPILVFLGLHELARRGFGIRLDFALVGGGMLMGEKVGYSVLAGAIFAWGMIGPFAESKGWVSDTENVFNMKNGARGLLLWPGVTFMAVDSFSQLFKAMVVAKYAATNDGGSSTTSEPQNMESEENDNDATLSATPFSSEENVPRNWWITGLLFAVFSSMVSQRILFGLKFTTSVMSIPVGLFMTYIAIRCAGETDINPIGPMGKIIQLIFAFLDPGQMIANLVTAAVACGGAGQAGDLMHDFKCGSILRLPPRTQLIAQMLGVPFGVLGAVPSFLLFLRTYELGGDEYPAPSAFAWKAVAEVLTGSSSEDGGSAVGVPHQAIVLSVLAALFAVFVRTLEFKMQYKGTARMKLLAEKIIPSPMALGIAFIIPPEFSVMVFFGALLSGSWRRRNKDSFESLSQLVAAGLLAGSGIAGVVAAGVTILAGG